MGLGCQDMTGTFYATNPVRADMLALIRTAYEQGVTLFDAAEAYGPFEVERIVGEGVAPFRDHVVLATKFGWNVDQETGRRLPGLNSRPEHIRIVVEGMLKRLKTDRIDLYLLHWRGSVPLEETVAGFEALRRDGKIRHWGVSNFDVDDMEELVGVPHGDACATNQILYNVARRGPEFDLLPWLAGRKMPAMAYSPVDHARLPKRSPLDDIAARHGVSVFQIALAWVLRQPDVFAIPKSGRIEHVRDNHRALDLQLSADDLAAIDAHFRPPRSKRPLEML